MALSKGSQEQGKKSGDEGLQKLGQEARSQAPSFSVKLDEYKSDLKFGDNLSVTGTIITSKYGSVYCDQKCENGIFTLDLYKLPEVSGFRMARKV